jgi:hypothetical protein
MTEQHNNVVFICMLVVIVASIFGFSNKGQKIALNGLTKPTVQNQYTLAGNNWAFEMTNYGSYAQDIAGRLPSGGAGGEFPKGTGTYIIFAAGIQIGALVNGVPKVSAVEFDSEFEPGALIKINPNDTTEVPIATDWGNVLNKLFVLNKDGSDGTPPGTNGDLVDDYANWPAPYGAPTKADGTPLVIGDMISWCVYNDMDPVRHTVPDNSQTDPLGLEVQQTSIQSKIGGYSDVFFMYYKIINKGTHNLRDVYIAGWSDPDVDKSSNDLVATDTAYAIPGTTDTVKNMVFTYNADNTDPVSMGGSAFGADFFQGPVVDGEPTDMARYLELTPEGFVKREVSGKKVLGLNTTVRYINVRGPSGDPDNDTELYNLMKGLEKNGDPKAFRYAFPADPLTALNGDPNLDPAPDDKRMMLSCGPFNLAVGDTQVVVLACIGGKGINKNDAIRNLRQSAAIAQRSYEQGFHSPQPAIIINSGSTQTELNVTIDLTSYQNVSSAQAHFSPQFGTEANIELFLFDDGLHQDSLAGDHIWGNHIAESNRKYPYKGDIIINTISSQDTFTNVLSNLALRPLPQLGNWRVIWENGQQDKKINNSETVHLTFNIVNWDGLNEISSISIEGEDNITPTTSDVIPVAGTYSDTSLYLILTGLSSGDSMTVQYTLRFDNHVVTRSSCLPLTEWNHGTDWGKILSVSSIVGNPDLLKPIVADPSLLTGHTYIVSFRHDTINNKILWRLTDETIGVVKLDNAPTETDENYPHPVIDGIIWRFETPSPGFKNFEVVANVGGLLIPPKGAAAATGYFDDGFPCEIPDDEQQIGPAKWFIHTGDNGTRCCYAQFVDRTTRSTSLWSEIVPYDFEVRFTSRGSYAFDAYGSGTAVIHVPFELWNIGIGTPNDTSDDYQMIAYLLDDDVSGTFNMGLPGTKITGTYDHSVSSSENDPYTDWIYWQRPLNISPGRAGYLSAEAEMIGGTYTGDRETEVMARMVFVNWNGDTGVALPSGYYNQPLPEEGTIFRITTTKRNLPGDLLSVSATTGINEKGELSTYTLFQNYPNPFNPATSIKYNLPHASYITLSIYNILGQRIAILVNKKQESGIHEVTFHADGLPSGVYFYRLEAGDFIRTRKLLLLK